MNWKNFQKNILQKWQTSKIKEVLVGLVLEEPFFMKESIEKPPILLKKQFFQKRKAKWVDELADLKQSYYWIL